jgi:hypothetical protein
MKRKLAMLAGVLAVLAIIYGIGSLTLTAGGSGASAVSAASVPAAVTSVIRACPPAAPGGGQARVALVAVPPTATGDPGAGTATLTPLTAAAQPAATAPAHRGGKATAKTTAKRTGTSHSAATVPTAAQPIGTVTVPDALSLQTPAAQEQPEATAVSATGSMAQGLAAEQLSSAGVSTVSCADPGSDLWFAGTGLQAGAAGIRLYLMNVDDLPATVDVTMLTDSGQVPGNPDAGITVPPHQTIEQTITQFVKGSEAVAVNVQTSSGRVSAAVWEGSATGGDGTWLPQAATPSTHVVIPGLAASGAAARLFVIVPGTNDAEVKATALTPQGRYLPFGSAAVSAPANAASSFALNSLGGTAAAIELSSNVPITAGVLLPGNNVGAFTAAVSPLQEQGVVAGNPARPGFTSGLLLTAPDGAAQAKISTLTSTASFPILTQTVTIAAGHTEAIAVHAPTGASQAFSIVITPSPGSGPLYAARLVTQGTGGLSGTVVSVIPVTSALTVVELPPASDSYSAVLP